MTEHFHKLVGSQSATALGGPAESSIATLREQVETRLQDLIPRSSGASFALLDEAICYSLFPGGKRMRPMLTLHAASMITDNFQPALPVACALEFLHTSSLIFDDLPCMDDAGLRRGRPTPHVVFGEAIAILTGLALLNRAYEILSPNPKLLGAAGRYIGLDGMIGGQAADLSAQPSLLRNRKTSSLMAFTLVAGPMVCNALDDQIKVLSGCGECIGEAYQIYDDLNDRLEQVEKTSGQDDRHGRASNYRLSGFDGCRARLSSLLNKAKEDVQIHFPRTDATQIFLGALDGIFVKL